jgi:hypothetical protein
MAWSDNSNSGRNLAIWDYRFCPVDSRKTELVIDSVNLQDGVIGSPPNLVNAVQGRVEYIQLSLFDCTSN